MNLNLKSMKQLYVLCSIYNSVNFSFEIDSITTNIKQNNVSVLVCDGAFRKCGANPYGSSCLCKECKRRTNAVLKRISGITILKMRDYIDTSVVHPKVSYNNLRELNKFEYKGFEIGYGVSSCYISLTRNLNPDISFKLRRTLDSWVECSMTCSDIAERVISNEYDLVYVVNGRLFDAKPFQEIAFMKSKHVILGESALNIDGQYVRMNFDNVRVHSVSGNCECIRKFWDNSKVPYDERVKIASSFYEKRANAIVTNDKVYVKGQTQGLLPENWNPQKTNIGIFNSSEDEFAAIGGEFEKDNLFESQLEGVKFILDNVKDNNIHFYLRVHPNLMNIRYKYHRELYSLPGLYNNITVIPGDSPISSYSLMRNCERIITFGSTMGVEAAYAGKIAMVMRPSFYYYLDVNFVPKSRQDVLDFIYGKVQFKPNKENALKYSYYYYNNERIFADNPDCNVTYRPFKIMGRKFDSGCMNLACSEFRMKVFDVLRLLSVVIPKVLVPKKEQ